MGPARRGNRYVGGRSLYHGGAPKITLPGGGLEINLQKGTKTFQKTHPVVFSYAIAHIIISNACYLLKQK